MRRISVVGNSGSGKSTLARRIAVALGVPHMELDAIHHLPGWEPVDPADFRRQVHAITQEDAWVIDGNYRTVVVDGPVWKRADTVVWLDLPRHQVMRQITWRTVRRTVRREELWNGNREPLGNLCFWQDESILHWAWSQHPTYQDRFSRATTDPARRHLEFVRLQSHAEADTWLATLGPGSTASEQMEG